MNELNDPDVMLLNHERKKKKRAIAFVIAILLFGTLCAIIVGCQQPGVYGGSGAVSITNNAPIPTNR